MGNLELYAKALKKKRTEKLSERRTSEGQGISICKNKPVSTDRERTRLKYNQLLVEYEKLRDYLDSPDIAEADREKRLPEFEKLCKDLADTFTETGESEDKFMEPLNVGGEY